MTEVVIRNGQIKTIPNLGIVPYDASYSQSVWDASITNVNVYPFTYDANYFILFAFTRFASPAVFSYELVEFNNKPVTWPIYIFSQARQNTALSPQYHGYGYVFYFATIEQPAFVNLLSLSYTHNNLGNGDIVYTIIDMQLTKIDNEYFIRCRARNQYKTIRLDGWDESKPHTCTATIAFNGATYTARFFIDMQLAATITFSSQSNGYTTYNWPNTQNFDTFYMNYANIPSYPDEAYVYGYSTMYLGFVAGWTMTSTTLFTEENYAYLVDLCTNRYNLSQSTDCVEIASGELSTARFGSSTFDSTFYMW